MLSRRGLLGGGLALALAPVTGWLKWIKPKPELPLVNLLAIVGDEIQVSKVRFDAGQTGNVPSFLWRMSNGLVFAMDHSDPAVVRIAGTASCRMRNGVYPVWEFERYYENHRRKSD